MTHKSDKTNVLFGKTARTLLFICHLLMSIYLNSPRVVPHRPGNVSVLRRARPSSVCSPPRSTCWSWFCTEGTSWTQAEATRTASRPTSTRLARLLTQSCVSTTPLRWDASPSAWYLALPSVPRPSPWCPSKRTHMHTFVCTLQALWVMIERFCLLTAIACLLLMDRVQVQLSAMSPPPLFPVFISSHSSLDCPSSVEYIHNEMYLYLLLHKAWARTATMRVVCPAARTTFPWRPSPSSPPRPRSTRRPWPPSSPEPTRCSQTSLSLWTGQLSPARSVSVRSPGTIRSELSPSLSSLSKLCIHDHSVAAEPGLEFYSQIFINTICKHWQTFCVVINANMIYDIS